MKDIYFVFDGKLIGNRKLEWEGHQYVWGEGSGAVAYCSKFEEEGNINVNRSKLMRKFGILYPHASSAYLVAKYPFDSQKSLYQTFKASSEYITPSHCFDKKNSKVSSHALTSP